MVGVSAGRAQPPQQALSAFVTNTAPRFATLDIWNPLRLEVQRPAVTQTLQDQRRSRRDSGTSLPLKAVAAATIALPWAIPSKVRNREHGRKSGSPTLRIRSAGPDERPQRSPWLATRLCDAGMGDRRPRLPALHCLHNHGPGGPADSRPRSGCHRLRPRLRESHRPCVPKVRHRLTSDRGCSRSLFRYTPSLSKRRRTAARPTITGPSCR